MHSLLLGVTAAIYFLSTVAYFVFLAIPTAGPKPDERIARLARHAFVIGCLTHALAIAVRCSKGIPPVLTIGDTLGFYSFALVAGFLALQVRWKLPTVGAFVSPLVCLLVLAAVVLPKPQPSPEPVYHNLWFPAHVLLAVGGDVAFVLAAVVGLMYLIQEASLKSHHMGAIARRLPNLEILDRMNLRLVTIGFPLLTLAILTGVFWLRAVPELGATVRDPKIVTTLATWVLYAALLNGRLVLGLRGRKAAILSLAGFGLVLATFFSVKLLGSSFHGFAG